MKHHTKIAIGTLLLAFVVILSGCGKKSKASSINTPKPQHEALIVHLSDENGNSCSIEKYSGPIDYEDFWQFGAC